MNLLNIDLNLLKVLHALIEEQNVTRAGERIGRSQPAMSNALNRLRAMLDDPLLVRSAGGLQLTPRAESLKEPVAEILNSIETCLVANTEFVPEDATGIFRIAAPDNIGLIVLPQLIARISRIAPGMDIHVITEDREAALEALDKNHADIALGSFTAVGPSILKSPMFVQDFVCLARKGHPVLKGPMTTEKMLAYPHLLVSASGARTGIFDNILEDVGIKRRLAVSVSHFLLAPYLLEDSDMIGVFTRGVSRTLRQSFKLVECELPFTAAHFETSMIWHVRNEKDPALGWLRGQIIDICREMESEAEA